MNKELFTQLISNAITLQKALDKLYEMNIDLTNFEPINNTWDILDCIFDYFFTDTGVDLIYWYLFENNNEWTKEECWNELKEHIKHD